ncbi:beta-phosphoglucomutase [Lactiplantibacillus pentosus]|uniref:Beta-phosphoglucomutase n=1 Tax=Lactiplantibacillus pentosus TaxID=1589 RepID=A0AAW8VTZ4_LACPE|nr:beta-phosphoglucomutase [Lactiplantibacillus pentosus]MBU7473640.1 beta-phosphoglucomutase [Lactiplantibacillus pentosus]MBU7528478.1 beta-phosphoglucomutase [Lactiplantibacillus pentosus]MCT3305044.1 beta-phosphoglucomutase [Lactiplantibacillus pentosus]MDT6989744.1 beta-phosphoglucomutase [Lactiplantibacillus pentosus]
MATFEDIKGFVFDLDGVITDTAAFHTQAWHQVADKVGVEWDDQLGDALKGISRMDSLNLILERGNKENAFTEDEKVSLATEKNENYLTLVNQMTPANILPGISEFLVALQDQGYQMSLASASKNSPLVLKNLGLSRFFTKAVDPTTLKHGKPDPEIFRRGAELLALDPSQCIGVEDAAAGVAAINAAGETSIGIGNPETLASADINFTKTTLLTLDNIKSAMDR